LGTQSSKLQNGKHANVGDDAPDFTLKGAGGAITTLSDLRNKKRALLIFYPKDMTSG
jgi:peroxiredoxin